MADAFDHPPVEVQRFFDAKTVKPSFDWRDFSFDEHATAFTVAKSAGYDILGDVKDALSKAIRDRQDFAEFRAGLEPTLRAKGWWGKARQIDPATGIEREVQLGSPPRLQTIYWANVNSAYAAGEWERIQRTKRVLPFLEYLHTTAEHPRLQHLAWVGTILPVDDAWWASHYPPNGWKCQCRVRQLSDAEAERRGYNAEDPDEPADFGSKSYVNKRTGEVEEVPVGIDPGWAMNPGAQRTANAANFLAGRVNAMSDEARDAAIADLADSWLMRRIASGTIPFDPASRDPAMAARGEIAIPFAALSAELASAIGAEGRAVSLSIADAAAIGAVDYSRAQRLIDQGAALREGDGALTLFATIDGKTWQATVRRTADGGLRLAALGLADPARLMALIAAGQLVREAVAPTAADRGRQP